MDYFDHDALNLQQLQEADAIAQYPLADPGNPFEALPGQIFYETYRFEKEACAKLLREVLPYLPHRVSRSTGLPPFMRVLVTLQYLGTGNFYWCVARTLGISKSSAWRYVQDGLAAITHDTLVSKWIPWFTPESARTMSDKYTERYSMPLVIGAIDGSHIPILAPTEHEPAYINRKGWASYNMLVVSDADGFVRHVDCQWPGSTHDSRIFNEGDLPGVLSNDLKPYCLIGDSGFPCRSYILTPFPQARVLTDNEERYQRRLCRARQGVERVFGVMKARFHILARQYRGDLAKLPEVCMACCLLNNIATVLRQPVNDDEAEALADEGDPEGFVDNGVIANAVRVAYSDRYCMGV